MLISGNNSRPDAIMKFDEEFEYINSKLKTIRNKILSIYPTDSKFVNTSKDELKDTSNLGSLRTTKVDEAEKKISDLLKTNKTVANSHNFPVTNSPKVMTNRNMVPTNPIEMCSEVTGCQCSKNSNENNDMTKKNVMSKFVLNNKTEKTARKPNWCLKMLNNNVLPRSQSEDIATADIAKRSINVQSKVTRGSQISFKKQLDKNIIGSNEKSTKISKPKSKYQEKLVHIQWSNKNELEINNSCEIDSVFKLNELTRENSMNNVGIVNVSYNAKVPDEKENNDYKFKNLTVQKTPRVDLRPDLVTQKLTNIQIKPDNKTTLCNSVPNVAYSEFAFELDPETSTNRPLIQQRITKSKKEARNEIREILSGMLDYVSPNDSMNDKLLSELKKILINLEETNSSNSNKKGNNSSQLEYLVEQHSIASFNENIVKRRLLEIAGNVIDDENGEFSFDQMSKEIEKNSQQLLQKLNKIKNTIFAISPWAKFANDNNQQAHDGVKNAEENDLIQFLNNNINSKNVQDNEFNGTNRFVSLREYLNQGSNNSMRSKMYNRFENVSVAKESDSENAKDSKIQNPNTFSITNTQNTLIDNKNTHQLNVIKLNN